MIIETPRAGMDATLSRVFDAVVSAITWQASRDDGRERYEHLRGYLRMCMVSARDTVNGWYIEVEDVGSQHILDFDNQRWWVVVRGGGDALSYQPGALSYQRLPSSAAQSVLLAITAGNWTMMNAPTLDNIYALGAGKLPKNHPNRR